DEVVFACPSPCWSFFLMIQRYLIFCTPLVYRSSNGLAMKLTLTYDNASVLSLVTFPDLFYCLSCVYQGVSPFFSIPISVSWSPFPYN
uniref:Uncharacterized protein n=1 Tax=Aegilops tauschii subsp. strangulata TaxID=200361 RepID=A0A453KUE5_AEGTS